MVDKLLSNKYALIGFILCCLNFFGATIVPNIVSRSFFFLVLILAIPCAFEKSDGMFNKPLYLLTIVFVLNAFAAYWNYKQPITQYFGAEFGILGLFYAYYIFNTLNMPIKRWESVIYILGYLFCISYLIQLMVYPTVLFSGALSEIASGVRLNSDLRIRLIGQGLASLSYFFALNKVLLGERDLKNFCLLIMGFIVCLTLGFRSQFAVLILCTILIIIKCFGFTRRLFALVFFFLIITPFVTQIPIVEDKIEQMEARGEKDNFSNKNYIRYYSLNHYLKEMKKHPVSWITGLGLPGNNSKYEKSTNRLKEKGIIWADWGLIGLTFMLGLPGVLIIIWIMIKAYRVPVPSAFYYIGIWAIFLIAGSLMTRELFRVGNPLIEAYMLAFLNKLRKNHNNLSIK